MTAIAALVIADGQATPVNHTFSPVDVRDGLATWADRASGVSIGFPILTQRLRRPTTTSRNASGNYKLTLKGVFPVLEQTSPSTATGIQPAPTVAYTPLINIEIVIPERSTPAQRDDLIAYAKNWLASAPVTDAVKNYESTYG